MWLAYFRFEDGGRVDTYHVRAPNKEAIHALFRLAELRGLTPASKMVEYAFFYCRGTIKPKEVPNFHFYNHHEFVERWEAVEKD